MMDFDSMKPLKVTHSAGVTYYVWDGETLYSKEGKRSEYNKTKKISANKERILAIAELIRDE